MCSVVIGGKCNRETCCRNLQFALLLADYHQSHHDKTKNLPVDVEDKSVDSSLASGRNGKSGIGNMSG